MTPAQFLAARRPVWEHVEALVQRCGRRGLSALTQEEVRDLARLYPAIAVDVSRCRTYKLDEPTQQRVNRIAIAAHGLLYRRAPRRSRIQVWNFFRRDYPILFRRCGVYVALATTLFLVCSMGTYMSVRLRPSTAYVFVPGPLDMVDGEVGVSADDMSERFRSVPNPPLAAGVIANNISVAFNAFALGITAGIGTCWLLLVNGMMLGGFVGHFANHGQQYALMAFLMPHGVLEIMAILFAAGAGLRMGLALAVPGHLTRKASLRAGARDAVLLVLGTVPMFVVAGVIEGFVTPSHIPGWLKISLGCLAGATVLLWLLRAGREDARTAA